MTDDEIYKEAVKVSEINKKISELRTKNLVSDGSHNFGELYHHRMILFSVICNQNSELAWKSWFHDDETMFEDYFIVGIKTPMGDFTYHYHQDNWDMFDIEELERAPKWDGHESKDVSRLTYI
ncbi:MAG: WDGH domain-containing protein [Sphingobacterium sp.]